MAINIFEKSIWPNGLKKDDENYSVFYSLGQNKISIPTNVEDWPIGDKLISPFVYDEKDRIVYFCDTKAMIASDATTITMPYSHIEVDFSSIEEGDITINAPNATNKKIRWASSFTNDENIELLFKYQNCLTVDDVKNREPNYLTVDIVDGVWNENLSSLKNGNFMFRNNTDIVSFSGEMTSLNEGMCMFQNCTNLESIVVNLPSLTIGRSMFSGCSSLRKFESDLQTLDDASNMFRNCYNLEIFLATLRSITIAESMFENCTSLTTISPYLISLLDGKNMFSGCSLKPQHIKILCQNINTVGDFSNSLTENNILTLGLDCEDETALDYFANECGFGYSGAALIYSLVEKGWNIQFQYNPSSKAYSMRRDSSSPIFVKIEEKDKNANYISIDGTKKYSLNWFHYSSASTEGYDQFNSLEEAISHYNIKPI